MATIEKRGDFQWRARIRRLQPDGTMVARTRTFQTYDQAKAWADTLDGNISGDEYVDRSREQRITLKKLIERYLEEVTPTKKGSVQEGHRLRRWMLEEWASLPVVSVESAQIVEWRNGRVAEGKAPSTISNAMNILSAVYKQAISEWGYRLTNPLIGVKRPTPSGGRSAYVDVDEEEKLLAACKQGPLWLGWCVRIALATAMRGGEIRSLKWQHIHERQGWVHLPDTKNGESRDVPLITVEAIRVFREGRKALPKIESDWVFGDPHAAIPEGGFTADKLTQAFAKAAKRAASQSYSGCDSSHVGNARCGSRPYIDLPSAMAWEFIAEAHDVVARLPVEPPRPGRQGGDALPSTERSR